MVWDDFGLISLVNSAEISLGNIDLDVIAGFLLFESKEWFSRSGQVAGVNQAGGDNPGDGGGNPGVGQVGDGCIQRFFQGRDSGFGRIIVGTGCIKLFLADGLGGKQFPVP